MPRCFQRVRWLLLAAATLTISMVSSAFAAPEYGVGLTPANFPKQGDEDIAQMFRHAQEVASVGVISARWDDPGSPQVAEQMSNVARQFGLRTLIQLDVFESGGTRLAPPQGISGKKVDQAFIDAYVETARQLAAQKPAYLLLAVDINRLLAGGVEQLVTFAPAYKKAYRAAKQVSPETKVSVGFNWDIFRNASAQKGVPFSELRKLVDQFRPEFDVLAFSSTPSDQGESPAALPAGLFEGIGSFVGTEEVVLQTGWPSSLGGEAAQMEFVKRLPALTSSISPKLLIWPILTDMPFPGMAGTLGLFKKNGEAKTAAASFSALAHPGAARQASGVTRASVAIPQREPSRRNPSDKFMLWTSPLSGKDPFLVASDPRREINHGRVSPARDRVVFTRYNVFGPNGEAREEISYFQTEAVVCRIDGSNCEVVLPARPGILNANAYWTPDGQHLIYITNDTPSGLPAVALLDLNTHQITTIPGPPGMAQADPHMVRNLIVSPGRPPRGARYSALQLYDTDAKRWRQLTSPDIPGPVTEPLLGDHDPKLSPDGRNVVVMRHTSKDDWAVFLIDVTTGAERNLSPPRSVDAVPEWSDDGKLLIFWHVDRANLKNSGLVTMTPDGANRRRVPLPQGFFYTMPAFFPGDGSGPNARIIYSATPEPRM